jgi:thiamine transport system substrate-binding protein
MIAMMLVSISCSDKETGRRSESNDNVLKIYTYDSFVTWGLAANTIPAFEEQEGCRVVIESVGDAGNIINRLIMEKRNPQADIVIGIDNTMMNRILAEDLLVAYRSDKLDSIRDILHFDDTYHLIPYDYGYFAFVYDSFEIDDPPATFGSIQDGIWKNKLVISDPRTSSPGLGLLYWTVAAFGENGYLHFWRSVRNNILTVTSSWDEAYSMFLAGEVPIVLSYSTSPAFHIEVEGNDRYKAMIPVEGAFMQIEGAGIVAETQNLELAQRFIDYMLSLEFQEHIPATQWMYPVNDKVKLPESFNELPVPERVLNDELNIAGTDTATSDRWLTRWIEIMIE